MASTEELLEALDQRILEAIRAKATGETVVRLFEARAWLTHPDQAHGGSLGSA
jgi:hypothetical protein